VGELAHASRLERLREAITGQAEPEQELAPFAELVLAHYLRQLEVYRSQSYSGPQEQVYQDKLRAFLAANGRIVDAYWCTRAPSGVAVTERTARPAGRLWLRQSIVRFHAETDWITADAPPELAGQVHAFQSLAVKVGEVLRGTSELIAMQWLVTAVERLLGFVDQAERPLDEKLTKQVVLQSQDELNAIRRYYEKAAENQARLVYFQGMMRGAFLLAGLVAAVLGVLYTAHFSHWHTPTTQELLVAIAMGGVGAIISVMSRMAGKGAFSVDHEVGRKMVRRLGSLRPFIGATFAVAIYFGFASKLFQLGAQPKTIYFYAIVSFLAGFSERWAKVLLDSVGTRSGSAAKES
jgi:hypothetical protein